MLVFHGHEAGGGVGVDRHALGLALVHSVVGPVEPDVINVEHELVGAVEVDDGDVDFLSLVFPEVDGIVVPCAGFFGGHVGFPHDGEVAGVGVACCGDGHAEVLGGVGVVLGVGAEGNLLAVKLIGCHQEILGEQHGAAALVVGGGGHAEGVLGVAPVLAHLPAVAVAVGVDGGPLHDAVIEVEEDVALGRCGRGRGVVAQGIDADEVGASVDVAEEAGDAVEFADESTTSRASISPSRSHGEVEDVVGVQVVGLDVVVEDVGGESVDGEEIEVGHVVLVGEVARAMHSVAAETVCCGGLDDGAAAVDELEVKLKGTAGASGTFSHPEGVVVGVVSAGAEFIQPRVDLADQGLVGEVVAIDDAGVGVAAVEVLAVVGHVAHVVVTVVDTRDVEFLDEVAFEVVLVEHRQHRRRLAPCAGVEVLAVIDHAMLPAGGANERGDQVPHALGGLFLCSCGHRRKEHKC